MFFRLELQEQSIEGRRSLFGAQNSSSSSSATGTFTWHAMEGKKHGCESQGVASI